MKYRIAISLLVVVIVLATAALNSSHDEPTQSAPASSTDERALKSLSIN